MKKKLVSLALSLSTIFTIAAGNVMTANASCSGWTREPGWYVSCDWADRLKRHQISMKETVAALNKRITI